MGLPGKLLHYIQWINDYKTDFPFWQEKQNKFGDFWATHIKNVKLQTDDENYEPMQNIFKYNFLFK